MSSTEIEISKRFERKNEEVRAYYVNYKKCEDELRNKINELAFIVHDEHPDWSLNKIAHFIWVANQDLDGFSKKEIYRKVTDENRILLDVKVTKPKKSLPSELLEQFRKQKGQELQNNVSEVKFVSRQTNVIEDSSCTEEIDDSTAAMPQELELEQPLRCSDDPEERLEEFEEQIMILSKKQEELEEKYSELITPYEVKTTEIINNQELPFIIKVDPYKRTATIELDQKKVKKLYYRF
jgi:hypothetical protein